MIYDVKPRYVNGQIDVEQLEDYAKMIEILSTEGLNRTKLINKLKEKGINMDGFSGKVEVQYIVMPGKTNQVDTAVKAINKKKENFIKDKPKFKSVENNIIIQKFQ